jgi:hypothetical protein
MRRIIFLLMLFLVPLASAANSTTVFTGNDGAVGMNDLVNFMQEDRTNKMTFIDSSQACQQFAKSASEAGLEVGMVRFYNHHTHRAQYFNYIIIAHKAIYVDPQLDNVLMYSNCVNYDPNHPLNRTIYFCAYPNLSTSGYGDGSPKLETIKVKEIR